MPAEQHFCVPPCIFVPDRELDLLTDSDFKLNSLDDTWGLLDASHHKITFEHDEDTMSLVIDPTLTTAEKLLSDDSNFSARNAPTALEYYCCEIVADEPQFNYHGPKTMIPRQEFPITICTADTISTILSRTKKVLINIYCIEKCLLDLDPI